jgi:hypothetical protein
METIDDRIKRVNSKYEAPESIDERIKSANEKYQWDSSDKEMHDWFESTGRTTRSANSRLQNSSYANWKRDSENTKSAVDNDLEKADRIKSYLDSQREQLGEERYNTFMARYEEYKNALQQTSQNLQKESDYYSDTRNSGVMDTMTEDDMKGRLDDIKNEKKKNRSESFKNRVWAFLSTMQGNTADYEKYTEEAKAAKNKLNNLKSESAALESEIYNRDISEKLSQFDEATLKEIQSIPELKDRIKLEESVGTSGNNKNVYEYNQRLKEIEDKVRAKGMNPDELENYFAYEYNRRKNEQVQDAVRDFSADHQVIASALSVPVNLTSSGAGYLDAAAQQVGRKLTGSYAPVDYNRDAGIASRLSDTARGAVMDEHDWKLGDWDAFDFLYGTGMSALDSAASAAAGNLVGGALANTGAGIKAAGKVAEAVGGGILGLSAANSTMRDIKARGGNDDQAVIGGAVSGIFEGLFEKVSIGNFNKLKEVDPRSMRDVAMNILKSTGVNFSEEAATEIANIAYDTIANGDISNYKLMIAAYEKQGLSEAEAKKKVAGDLALQVVEAGAGGALMGAGFGVVGSGLGYLNHRKQGTNITGKTVAGFAGGEQTQIAQRLESLGENTQDAVRLSAVVQKQAEGDKLTRAEKRLFRGSENAQNVAAEIKNGTSDAAEDSQLSLKKDIETIKQEYKKAVNPKIVDFVERVRNLKDKNVAGKIKIELSSVNEREVQDIKKLTGIDTSEYKRDMDGNTVIHVENRHGENGAADHSMSDVNDLARIEYVLENYDNIESAKDDNGRYRDSDNKLSKSVVYSKRVNGNYYVVEAVPDSKAKTLHVVSAYKTKAEGVSQVLNMSEDLQSTSKTPHALAPSDNNISQKKSYVNAVPATIDGQSVTINGIDRIEKDGNRAQMYVKTQDGGSVALSDVRFDSRETEALYNVAQGFDSTDTARAFISGYKQGDSASEYMNAFLDFRRAGQLGQDFDSVLQSNANKYAGLEESQLRQAYYAGVNEKNNAPKHYSAKEEKRAEKNGGLLRNYTKKLNAEQAGSVYVLEALAKKYGFVVEVCDTLADGMANGEYDPKTGRIKIALDAEENAYLRTAGHELYHYIEDWNSTAAGELREYVIGKLKESENYDYEGRVKELRKLYEGFGKADIEAEIVAESMFDVFDEKTIRELVNENRPLAVKIQSWIRGFLESIEKALTAIGLKSPEVRALEGDSEALENIRDMFAKALEGTKEKRTSEKDAIKYELKNDAQKTELNSEDATRSQQFKDWFGDWENNPESASKVVNENGTPRVVYHGTKSDAFTVFDSSKANKKLLNRLGNGYYFAADIESAERYGDNVVSAYLDIKNPYRVYGKREGGMIEQMAEDFGMNASEISRNDIQDILKEHGYDGVMLYQNKFADCGTMVAFEPTQIKSATDNIGTFDRNNSDIRYSLKSTSAIEEQNKKLMQENKALREYKRELEWRLGINRKELDERAIRRLSKKVLKEYSSKYNAETLTQNLKNIFEALANMDDGITYDEVIARTAEVAKAVLEESAVLNTDMSEQYSALSEYAKGTKIKLSEQQKKEIAYYYGSYDKFRRKNFGKIRLSEEGSTLDSLWGEMSELWPEFFEPDTHELEQVQTLVNALETIKPFYENPFYDGSFDMDIDTASYDLAMRLYEEYYDIPELKTLRQKIEKEYRDRYDKRVEKIKEQEAAKRHKLSEELIKQKALYEQRTFEDRREWLRKDAMAKSKRSIERTAKTLNRFLQNPNKTQHVPEALRSALGEFLVSLDVYGNSQSKDAFEWRKSMSELQGELRKMQQGNDPQYQQFLADLDPDLMPMMTTLLEVYKGSSIKDMDAQGLAELETVMQQIKGGITRANELLANSRYGTVQAIADASVHEMDSRKSFKDKVKVGYKQLNVNMLDSFSFFHQLGPAAETVFKSIRSGFDERVEMIDNANEFMQSIVSQKEIQDWEHSRHTFKVEGGELTLTVSQMMELYNLSKREQARDHLLLGGIRPLDTSRQEAKMRIKEQFGKGEETYAKAVQVTVEDLGKIIDSLTPKQKQVAEKMQGFLSGNVADWGNKASMTLYGYRKFTEEHYWPIQVNKNSVRTMNAEDGAVQTQSNFYKLVNIGATKSVQRNASNGLFIKGAFDTFTKHITEMSAYSAYAVPVTDAMKWYNALSFEEKDDGYIAISGTKQSIERAFGNDGKAYFEKFILDLNGSSDSKNAGGAGEETLIRNFKVAAVGANMRVAIQQPTAYLRAAAVMNPKYLLKGLLSKPASKEAIDNCPIAKWKSWGFYETSMGITMKQLITGQQTVVDKIREKSMWLAGVGDELTWGTLWNACKAEVKDKTDLKEGTAEFTQAVSDRLSEVVDKTQVVDSLLHRSQFMRSTSSFSKILSAFKAEPTKSYNMLRNALVDYNNADPGSKKAKAKNIARIAAVHIATSILTAGIASIADAFRNDDDEKKWLELYLEAFGGNTLDGINPFSAVPYVGDILSILSGYSVSRMDIEGIEELIQSCESWQKVFSGEKKNPDIWKLMMSSAKGISKVSGLPIANTMRTFESLYNFFSPDNLGREASFTEYRKLYNSIAEGKYQKQYDKLIKKGYTAQQLENGVKNNLVKSEPRIAQAAQARERGNISEYKKIYEELVSEGYPSNAVIKAINNYMTMQTAAAQAKSNGDDSALSGKLEALLESGYDEDEVNRMIDEIAAELDPEAEQDKAVEEKKLYEYKDLQKALENSDVSSAKEIVEYLRANGKEDKTIRQALTKDLKSEYQEMYKSNDTEGMRRTRQMLYELNIGYDDKTFQRWIKDMTK